MQLQLPVTATTDAASTSAVSQSRYTIKMTELADESVTNTTPILPPKPMP